MEYVIYTDESVAEGPYYSNFYGGALVRSPDLSAVEKALIDAKHELNFFAEVKWSKVSAQYLDKYRLLTERFLYLVAEDLVKVRIMFTKNVHVATGLESHHHEDRYFILYYQFLKYAFGLQHSDELERGVRLRLNMDQLPGEKEAKARFRGYVSSLQKSPGFRKRGITIPEDQIAEVDSKKHVVLQCMDVILGAMQFRLNNKHKVKPPGSWKRGKKTIAKEKLYKAINARLRKIYPNFNVGITTGHRRDVRNRWRDPYRHWLFIPSNSSYDESRTKP